MVLGELEKIEVAVRAKILHELSIQHGAFWYTDSSYFKDASMHAVSLSIFSEEFKRSDQVFKTDFKRKYKNPLPPSWIMLEITSFGSLSKLYQNLAGTRGRKSIANYFGLDASTFQSWLHSIVYLRNVCAYHSRLWNRDMRISPRIPLKPRCNFLNHSISYDKETGRPINNNKVYFFLSMLIYWLNIINPGHSFKEKLFTLLSTYPMVDVKAMGFPDTWGEEDLWISHRCGLKNIY